MSGGGAAPDVDLRKQGTFGLNPIHGAIAVCIFSVGYYYSTGAGDNESAADGQDITFSGAMLQITWFVTRLLQFVFVAALIMLLVLVTRQRSILYVPVPPNTGRSPSENPSQMRSPDAAPWKMEYENVMITTEDGVKVNAWFIYHRAAATADVPYTVVYFHGNAGNIGFRLENLFQMHTKLKLNILILDYRSYGDSEDGGGPTEKGFLLDAKASYRWLVDRIKKPPATEKAKMSLDRILFFGRSIGGVVALRLGKMLLEERIADAAAGRPLEALPAGFVLENTFTSLRDMACQIFPFLYYLKPLLRSPIIFDEWKGNEAMEYMVHNNEHWCCCLLSGQKDTLVPPEQMTSLHELLKQREPKVLKFFRFRDGGHNDTPTRGGQAYWDSFQKFLDAAKNSEPERVAHFAAQEQ